MRRLWLVAGLLLGMGLAAGAQTVNVDYNHGVNFRQFRTYSWTKLVTPSQLWDQRVRLALDSELASRGLHEVPSGGQLCLSVIAMTRNRNQLETFYNDGWGWSWGWRGWGGPGIATTNVIHYQVGTLVVDLFDSAAKQLVWRGSATETLSEGNPTKTDKKVDQAVKKLFDKYPPKFKRS